MPHTQHSRALPDEREDAESAARESAMGRDVDDGARRSGRPEAAGEARGLAARAAALFMRVAFGAGRRAANAKPRLRPYRPISTENGAAAASSGRSWTKTETVASATVGPGARPRTRLGLDAIHRSGESWPPPVPILRGAALDLWSGLRRPYLPWSVPERRSPRQAGLWRARRRGSWTPAPSPRPKHAAGEDHDGSASRTAFVPGMRARLPARRARQAGPDRSAVW